MIVIIHLQRGIPSKRKSSTCIDYVPALCTHRPSLLPIEWISELQDWCTVVLHFTRWELNQTCSFRGSKSRNKVSVGEPAEGSLTRIHTIINQSVNCICCFESMICLAFEVFVMRTMYTLIVLFIEASQLCTADSWRIYYHLLHYRSLNLAYRRTLHCYCLIIRLLNRLSVTQVSADVVNPSTRYDYYI